MAGLTEPFLTVDSVSEEAYRSLRRRAIFDCCKWDPQVGDVPVIARHPLVITRRAWSEVTRLAEALAREAADAERELVLRPDLHSLLGLGRRVRGALSRIPTLGPTPGIARIVRFDFHPTAEGWRVSEANADVPGGLNEASGFAPLMAQHFPWAAPVGDPAGAYADALLAGGVARVALVHATAYSDDLQMMRYVADRLRERGADARLASPADLQWTDGRPSLTSADGPMPIDRIARFFPGDWLPELPRRAAWRHFAAGSVVPISNPLSALVIQSKRFPLVWDQLETRLPTWRQLLPDTTDPRSVRWQGSPDWIVKPAFGRVGEGIGMSGVVAAGDWKKIARAVRWFPQAWIAQRRFISTTVDAGGAAWYPCLGVYTVDGKVVGAYGRLARRPLIDANAEDAAVLAA
jgi:hypothetical protein